MIDRTALGRLSTALLLSAAVLIAWMVFTNSALAQANGTIGDFSCSDGRASGHLYESGASCPTTLSFQHLFSFLICNMERLSSDIMGNMYCGMVKNLVPMVMGALTLATVIFGIGFTIGVIPATAREFQKFLLKVVLVYVFATQAEYMIGIAYRFFVVGAREGIAISLSGLYPTEAGVADAQATGADIYANLDRFLGRAIQFATDYIGKKWDGSENPCQNAIFAVMAIMAVAFPPLFYLSILIIFKIAMTFLRAVFGYIYAIIGMAFLMALAPFFLSFALWTQTRPFFDKWIGYLISFALQMVIVFAFLAFIVSIDVKHISGSLIDIIVPVQETRETTTLRLPWKYCTLCEFKVVRDDGKGGQTEIPEDQYDQFIKEGKLVCKDNPGKPIKALAAASPEGGQAPDKKIQNALLKFAGTALISLLLLAYIIDYILRYIPSIAQSIAGGGGAGYAPQLGGGYSPRQIATTQIPLVDGMGESFERGFHAGYTKTAGEGKSSVTSAVEGFKQGMSLMITGSRSNDPAARDRDPGLIGGFTRWLINPHHDVE